jgi:chromosome segregation ATPase
MSDHIKVQSSFNASGGAGGNFSSTTDPKYPVRTILPEVTIYPEAFEFVKKQRDKAAMEIEQLQLALKSSRDEVEKLKEEISKSKSMIESLYSERKRLFLERADLRKELDTNAPARELSIQLLELIKSFNSANAARVKVEPSRLEIAAMLLSAQPPPQAGSFSGQSEHALKRADALIAAAREVK